jgi:hypothetical protein
MIRSKLGEVRGALVLAVAAVILVPGTARAGRSYFGWLYGTEVLPERGVELQSWILEEDNQQPNHSKESDLWWGPLIGVTDQLELALPVEMGWQVADGQAPSFTLQRYGVEARYRFVTQDPVDAPDFVPLVRVAVKRDVVERDALRVEGDLVASYQSGRVFALVDAGYIGQFRSGETHQEIRPGAGVSVQVVGDLRLGVEAYAELGLDSNEGESWAVVGPDLAWTHGRFWLSAAYGIGVYQIKAAPRMMWGVLF